MTKLSKSVRRELTIPTVSRPVIVEMDPETKRIGFHEKGCRKVYWLSILTAYALAIRADDGDK